VLKVPQSSSHSIIKNTFLYVTYNSPRACYCTADNGHFYCGQRVLTCSCCDGGMCGPTSGCNCAACKQLDAETADTKQRADFSDVSVSAAEMISSWTWGKQPGRCRIGSMNFLNLIFYYIFVCMRCSDVIQLSMKVCNHIGGILQWSALKCDNLKFYYQTFFPLLDLYNFSHITFSEHTYIYDVLQQQQSIPPT